MSEPTIQDIGRRYRSRIERATKAAYRDAYALNKTAEMDVKALTALVHELNLVIADMVLDAKSHRKIAEIVADEILDAAVNGPHDQPIARMDGSRLVPRVTR